MQLVLWLLTFCSVLLHGFLSVYHVKIFWWCFTTLIYKYHFLWGRKLKSNVDTQTHLFMQLFMWSCRRPGTAKPIVPFVQDSWAQDLQLISCTFSSLTGALAMFALHSAVNKVFKNPTHAFENIPLCAGGVWGCLWSWSARSAPRAWSASILLESILKVWIQAGEG